MVVDPESECQPRTRRRLCGGGKPNTSDPDLAGRLPGLLSSLPPSTFFFFIAYPLLVCQWVFFRVGVGKAKLRGKLNSGMQEGDILLWSKSRASCFYLPRPSPSVGLQTVFGELLYKKEKKMGHATLIGWNKRCIHLV